MVSVKGNRPTLFARLKALPWGRCRSGTAEANAVTAGGRPARLPAITVQTLGWARFPPRAAGRPDHPYPY
jgi:hypothetical protein